MPHTRTPGRRATHGSPLPNIEAVAAIRTLRRVMKEKKWTPPHARREYEKIATAPAILRLDDAETRNAVFEISLDTFKKASSEPIERHLSLNHDNKWGIYLWMRECYPDYFRDALIEETFQNKEIGLYAFNELLGYNDVSTIKALVLKGSYNLYRPAYFDPSGSVLIQRLVVGGENDTDIFDCALTGEYEKRPGVVIQDDFTGKIAPQDRTAAAILKAPHDLGGFIMLHFDDIETNYARKETISISGLMVTALGNGRSSAWPVYAERVDAEEKIPTPILTGGAVGTLPDRIIDALRRGTVHWDARYYPHSLTGSRHE